MTPFGTVRLCNTAIRPKTTQPTMFDNTEADDSTEAEETRSLTAEPPTFEETFGETPEEWCEEPTPLGEADAEEVDTEAIDQWVEGIDTEGQFGHCDLLEGSERSFKAMFGELDEPKGSTDEEVEAAIEGIGE